MLFQQTMCKCIHVQENKGPLALPYPCLGSQDLVSMNAHPCFLCHKHTRTTLKGGSCKEKEKVIFLFVTRRRLEVLKFGGELLHECDVPRREKESAHRAGFQETKRSTN